MLQWIVLALWKVSDYKNKKGQDASKYLVKIDVLVIDRRHSQVTCRIAQKSFTISSPQNGTTRLVAVEVMH